MKSIGIRKAIQLFGGTNIDVHKGYHYQSGFFDKDGKTYYIDTGDDRILKNGQLDIMYREAIDRKDFSGKGGHNQWDFVRIINSMGYKIDKFPKEKKRY